VALDFGHAAVANPSHISFSESEIEIPQKRGMGGRSWGFSPGEKGIEFFYLQFRNSAVCLWDEVNMSKGGRVFESPHLGEIGGSFHKKGLKQARVWFVIHKLSKNEIKNFTPAIRTFDKESGEWVTAAVHAFVRKKDAVLHAEFLGERFEVVGFELREVK
jgi:hypothetical protein